MIKDDYKFNLIPPVERDDEDPIFLIEDQPDLRRYATQYDEKRKNYYCVGREFIDGKWEGYTCICSEKRFLADQKIVEERWKVEQCEALIINYVHESDC